MKKFQLGLAFGPTNIKFLLAKSYLGRVSLLDFIQKEIPFEQKDDFTFKKKLVAEIFSSLPSGRIGKIFISFPQNLCWLRKFTFPPMSWPKLRKAIALQANTYLPLKPKDLFYEAIILEKQEKKMEVLVVAVQRSKVEEWLSLFSDSSPSYFVLEPDFISLFNYFKYLFPSQEEHLSLLHLTGPTGTLVVLKEGRLRFTHHFSNWWTDGNKDRPKLAREIKNSLYYYQKQNSNQPELRKIYLAGEVDEQIENYLAEKFENFKIKTVTLSPSFKKKDKTLPASFFLLAGLLLPTRNKSFSINLLAPKKTPITYDETKIKLGILLSPLLLALLAIIFLSTRVLITSIRHWLLERRIKQLTPALFQISQSEDFKNHILLMESLLKNKTGWGYLLYNLSQKLPKNLWLTNITASRTRLKRGKVHWIFIEGEAFKIAQITQFTSSLEQDPLYQNVTCGEFRREKKVIRFQIKAEINFEKIVYPGKKDYSDEKDR
jgi:Tfp pilus assembly PilM family ATPase/Tfp pilus assembly protein PilN